MYNYYLKLIFVGLVFSFFYSVKCEDDPEEEFDEDQDVEFESQPPPQQEFHRNEVEKHVGCILYRRVPKDDTTEVQFLLLQPSKRRFRWIPPKGLGQFDHGETEETAAVYKLEAKTGLTKEDIRVVPGFIKYTQFRVDGVLKTTAYILAELLKPDQELRRLSRYYLDFKWSPISEACSLAMFGDLCEVLTSSFEYLKQYKSE